MFPTLPVYCKQACNKLIGLRNIGLLPYVPQPYQLVASKHAKPVSVWERSLRISNNRKN